LFEQRTVADEIDVLFGKQIAAPTTDKRLQALTFAGSQNYAATPSVNLFRFIFHRLPLFCSSQSICHVPAASLLWNREAFEKSRREFSHP
jgi:hypothetical protein